MLLIIITLGFSCLMPLSTLFNNLEKISNLDDSSKLFLYGKLKTDIKLEDYLKLTKNFNNRHLLTKFRTSDHPLEIELGTYRYKKISRHQRLCKTCQVLDDEIHFFLQCQINNNLRNVLINNIKSIMLISTNWTFFSQLEIILIPDQEFLPSVVDYIN